MVRYYFDSRDDHTFLKDDEGLEFASLEQVRFEASRALAEMAVDSVTGSHNRMLSIEVRDEEGPLLVTRMSFEVEMVRD